MTTDHNNDSVPKRRSLSDYLHLFSLPSGLLMLILVVAEIVCRVFDKSIIWAPSLESLLLIVLAFSSVSITYREGTFISTDFLVIFFGKRLRFITDMFVQLVGLICCIAIVWLTGVSAFSAIGDQSRPPFLEMPLWPWRMILPIGTAFLTGEVGLKIIRTIKQFRGKEN